jgi:hypothetical protein
VPHQFLANSCQFLSILDFTFSELGSKVKEELLTRIMVLDGAMGTMIQMRDLEEEDFRGNKMLCKELSHYPSVGSGPNSAGSV